MKTTKPLSAGFSEIEPSSFGIGAVLLCLDNRAVSICLLVSVGSGETGSRSSFTHMASLATRITSRNGKVLLGINDSQESAIRVRIVDITLGDQCTFGEAKKEENGGRKESNEARERQEEN